VYLQHNTKNHKHAVISVKTIPHHGIPGLVQNGTTLTKKAIEQHNISQAPCDQRQHDHTGTHYLPIAHHISIGPHYAKYDFVEDRIRMVPMPLFLAQVRTPTYTHRHAVKFSEPRQLHRGHGSQLGQNLRLDPHTHSSIPLLESAFNCSDTCCRARRAVLAGIGTQFGGDLHPSHAHQWSLDEGSET